MNGPRNLRLAVIFVILAAGSCAASDIYFAQNAAGGGGGTSCATAESVATFNAGSATAGNTYHLCGTVTAPVSVPACTSGSGSSKCELLFDSGSTGNITAAALSASGAIVLQPYWIVDGGTACGTSGLTSNFTTWQTSCASGLSGTGFISNTANGTGLANQVATLGITAAGGIHDIEIRNLIIKNLYQKTAYISDTSTGAQNSYAIYLSGVGNNILVHDNAINMVNTGIYVALTGNSANTQVYKNVVSNNKWGILTAQGTGVSTGTYDYFNDVSIGTLWNTDQNNGNPYHTDYLFLFGQNSSVYMNGAYVYGNYLHGAGGSYNTSDGLYYCMSGFIYDNQNQQNQYIFNNVFNLTSGYSCGGLVTTGYGTTSQFIFNNTYIGYGATACYSTNSAPCTANADFGANASASTTIENNIVSGLNSPVNYNHSGAAGFVAVDYNDYYAWNTQGVGPWDDGTIYNCFKSSDSSCTGTGPWDAQFEAHGTEGNPNLTSTFHLTNSSSAAWKTATNLYSTCNGQPTPGLGALCSDAAGLARPSTGNWDMGAYEDSASNAPAPPSELTATVQ